METFRTVIRPVRSPDRINYGTPLMMLGSCFAENIGCQLQRLKFNMVINPFGTVFHPLPIARQLQRMIAAEKYTKDDLLYHHESWISFDHHGRFSHPDADVCLQGINRELLEGRRQLTQAGWIFVAFGTAWAYRRKDTGQIAANCHQYPAGMFERVRSGVDEICEKWEKTIAALHVCSPDAKIVFTVSPVRHLRDGAHENQLSKATLLLSVERLNSITGAGYFPAYEILLDDLRDYRFYGEDMTHPSPAAMQYIREYFRETYLTDEASRIMKEVEDIVKASDHRPVHRNAATRAFAANCLDKIRSMQQRFPQMNFTDEITLFEQMRLM
ncbi:MAG: GSCFA domain-containing protein [Bacteroidales bacterium]|jgi:hypothetical protein|nr:GSCFA domain-containing protein [Bacteroidales bacterium]